MIHQVYCAYLHSRRQVGRQAAGNKLLNFQKNSLGIVLLEKVFNYLEIIEKDYFGLVFIAVDNSSAQQKVFSTFQGFSYNNNFRNGWIRRKTCENK